MTVKEFFKKEMHIYDDEDLDRRRNINKRSKKNFMRNMKKRNMKSQRTLKKRLRNENRQYIKY